MKYYNYNLCFYKSKSVKKCDKKLVIESSRKQMEHLISELNDNFVLRGEEASDALITFDNVDLLDISLDKNILTMKFQSKKKKKQVSVEIKSFHYYA